MFTTNKWMDFSEIQRSSMWLFNKGRKNKEIAKIIGKAAAEFIDHPSLTKERLYNDAIPWLTFLAHEFGNLEPDKIKFALEKFQPIGQEINSVLIARLGYLPNNFHPGRDGGNYLIFAAKKIKTQRNIIFQGIVDVTRDSEEVNSDIVNWIELTLISDAFRREELEALAIKSKIGSLFSSIVLFCRGNFHEIDWLIRLLGIHLSRDRNNRSANYMINVASVILDEIEEDPKLSKEYYSTIKRLLQTKNHENIIELYKVILTKKELFDIQNLTDLLSEISDKSYELDFKLASGLINFFLELEHTKREKVVFELKKIIAVLNGKDNKFEYQYRYAGLDKLLFSISLFYLQQKIDDEACNVFLSGLEYVFITYYEPVRGDDMRRTCLNGRDIFRVVSPILNEVNPQLIQECIKRGINSDRPGLSSLCQLLTAFPEK